MINGWLALIILAVVVISYWVGYWQAQADARRDRALRNRQKFDTMKAMNYTKRGL